jgi:uncharacterized protein (UPF0333 family)
LKNDLENIETLFKQTFDGFEADVSPNVWGNIQGSIGSHAVSKTVASKSIALKVVTGVLVVGSLVTGSYFISINSGNDESAVTVKAPLEIIARTKEKFYVAKQQEKKEVKQAQVFQDVVVESIPAENREKVRAEKVVIEKLAKAADIESQNVKIEAHKAVAVSSSKTEVVVASAEKSNIPVKQVVEQAPVVQQVVVVPVDDVESDELLNADWGDAELSENEQFLPSINKDKIPRSFSPNGDGIGDVIRIEGKNIKEFHASILSVSSGKVVFEWFWIEGVWDGTDMMGNKVPRGTYMLLVIAAGEDGKPILIQQTVTLY